MLSLNYQAIKFVPIKPTVDPLTKASWWKTFVTQLSKAVLWDYEAASQRSSIIRQHMTESIQQRFICRRTQVTLISFE